MRDNLTSLSQVKCSARDGRRVVHLRPIQERRLSGEHLPGLRVFRAGEEDHAEIILGESVAFRGESPFLIERPNDNVGDRCARKDERVGSIVRHQMEF